MKKRLSESTSSKLKLTLTTLVIALVSLQSFAVVNGTTLTGDDSRWVVKYGVCTAGVLNDRIVITAAHCPPAMDIEITDYVYDLTEKRMVQKTIDYIEIENSWSRLDTANGFDGTILVTNEPIPKHLVPSFPKLASRAEREQLKKQHYFVSQAIGYGFSPKNGEPLKEANFGLKKQGHLVARHWSILEDLLIGTFKFEVASRYGDWFHYASDDQSVSFGDSGGPTLVEIGGEWKWLGVNQQAVANRWKVKKIMTEDKAFLLNSMSMDVLKLICTAKAESDIPEIQAIEADCED